MAFGINFFNKKEVPKKSTIDSSLTEKAKDLASGATKLSTAALALLASLEATELQAKEPAINTSGQSKTIDYTYQQQETVLKNNIHYFDAQKSIVSKQLDQIHKQESKIKGAYAALLQNPEVEKRMSKLPLEIQADIKQLVQEFQDEAQVEFNALAEKLQANPALMGDDQFIKSETKKIYETVQGKSTFNKTAFAYFGKVTDGITFAKIGEEEMGIRLHTIGSLGYFYQIVENGVQDLIEDTKMAYLEDAESVQEQKLEALQKSANPDPNYVQK